MQQLVGGPIIDDVLAPYRVVARSRGDGGCWVLANMVAGLDGTAAVAGRVGPLSAGPDRELFRLLRAVADVVLVGAQTVRREGYGPVVLPEAVQAARVAAGGLPVPPVAVVSRSLDLDWESSLFTAPPPSSPTVVVTTAASVRARPGAPPAGATLVEAAEEALDMASLLGALEARGHRVVLCEGGPSLLGQLVAADRLDELCLTLAPVLGGDPLPVALTPPGSSLAELSLRHTAVADDTLFLRYEARSHG